MLCNVYSVSPLSLPKYARMYLSVILKWELCVLSVWGQNLGSARLTMSWACTTLDTRRRRSTRPCSTSTELPTVYMYIYNSQHVKIYPPCTYTYTIYNMYRATHRVHIHPQYTTCTDLPTVNMYIHNSQHVQIYSACTCKSTTHSM